MKTNTTQNPADCYVQRRINGEWQNSPDKGMPFDLAVRMLGYGINDYNGGEWRVVRNRCVLLEKTAPEDVHPIFGKMSTADDIGCMAVIVCVALFMIYMIGAAGVQLVHDMLWGRNGFDAF